MTTEYKITKQSQSLQHAASKDNTRASLLGVNFNVNHAVATDGSILALRLKEAGEPIAKTLKFKSGKQKTDYPFIDIATYKSVDDKQALSLQGQDLVVSIYEYPDYMCALKTTLTTHKDDMIHVPINLAKLINLGKALELKGKDQTITLAIPKEGNNAIVVASNHSDTVGIIMPTTKDTLCNPLDKLKTICS